MCKISVVFSTVNDATVYQQKIKNSTPIVKLNSEENLVTLDDAEIFRSNKNAPLQHYDAFILYADEDFEFAKNVIDFAENCGLKVFVKERDMLAGISFEHDAIRRLLTHRCNRLVVLLSKSFIESPANEFITKLAQSIGIQQQNRKIVPCIIENDVKIPELFHHYHPLNYVRSMKFNNFWDKLEKSLVVRENENTHERSVSKLETATNTNLSSPVDTPSTSSVKITVTPSVTERSDLEIKDNIFNRFASKLRRSSSTQSMNTDDSREIGLEPNSNRDARKTSVVKSLTKFFRNNNKIKSESNVVVNNDDIETSDNAKNEHKKKSKDKKKKSKIKEKLMVES